MRNAQKTVPTTVGSMALAPVVPQKAGVKADRNRVPAPKSVTTELKRTNTRCGWEWEDQKSRLSVGLSTDVGKRKPAYR